MNKKTFIWLTAIVLFAAVLRIIFFSGIGASDDLGYTRYAYDISKNSYSFPASHQGTRLGLLYIVGFLYNLFGVNEFSSNAFVFLTSIAGILLIFYFGKIFFSEKVGLLAAFLLSFFPLDAVFATKLLSDFPSAFFLSLGIFFFLLGEKHKSRFKVNINFILSGISIGAAYLIRETALLALLFFGAYALFYKKMRLNYFLIFFGFIAMFTIEAAIFHAHTGDFLYRIKALGSNYEKVAESNNFFGRNSFPFSLAYYPYLLFTTINFGLFYPFILIAVLYCLLFKKKETYPFIIWLVALLSYLSFGTVSFSHYTPFSGTPRYLSVITFPAMLILAYFLLEDKSRIMKKAVMPSIIVILLITSIGFVYINDTRNSIGNLRELYPYISGLDKHVYTDSRSKSVLEYLSGYNNNIILKEFGDNASNIKNAYVLVNKRLIKAVAEAHPFIEMEYPKEISEPPKNWIIIKKIGKGSGSTILYYAQ